MDAESSIKMSSQDFVLIFRAAAEFLEKYPPEMDIKVKKIKISYYNAKCYYSYSNDYN